MKGPTRVEALSDLLATNGLDTAAAWDIVAALGAAGLVDVTDDVASLSPAGTARSTEVRDRIAQVTARIFEQFDAGRVETTRGLLQEIADCDPVELTRRSVRAG